MAFNFKHYLQLVNERKIDEAFNYRINQMPKTLYKYVSLQDLIICSKDNDECLHTNSLNEMRFNSLEKNRLWMSRFDNLNDPYEYKAMHLKRDELIAKGWPIEIFEYMLFTLKKMHVIASFTTNLVDNMPNYY